MPSWDDLYKRATEDHARWRGRKVSALNVGIGFEYRKLSQPVEVTIEDAHLSEGSDLQPFSYQGGLLDTYYPTKATESLVWAVYGPTYYLDGRVEYPEWWGSIPEGETNA
jgi:hypothetical protein